MFMLALALSIASHDMPAYVSDGPLAHPPARRGHAMWCALPSPLAEGYSVYVYGGKGESSRLFDLWKYEEPSGGVGASGRWFLLTNNTPPFIGGGLSGMAHWMDATGTRLWVHGGRYDDGSISPAMWYYDVQWRTVNQATVPPSHVMAPRFGHLFWYYASTDSLYLYGGKTTGGNLLQDMWRFHVPSATWHSIGNRSEPGPRDDSGVVTLGSKVYIFGGDLWVYDMATNAWAQLASLSDGGAFENPTMLARGDHIVLSGGDDTSPHSFIYTISTNTWSSATTSTELGPRWGSSACTPGAGVWFVFGGVNGAKYYNDLWIHRHALSTTTAPTTVPPLEIVILLLVGIFAALAAVLYWKRHRAAPEIH